jgi:hypothetical protein
MGTHTPTFVGKLLYVWHTFGYARIVGPTMGIVIRGRRVEDGMSGNPGPDAQENPGLNHYTLILLLRGWGMLVMGKRNGQTPDLMCNRNEQTPDLMCRRTGVCPMWL